MTTGRSALLKRHLSTGTLLIEVLVSISILSVSIVVILQAMTTAMNASAMSQRYVEAANILESHIAEFLLIPHLALDDKEYPAKGNFDDYTLSAQLQDITIDGGKDLSSAMMRIKWGQETRKGGLSALLVYAQRIP